MRILHRKISASIVVILALVATGAFAEMLSMSSTKPVVRRHLQLSRLAQ